MRGKYFINEKVGVYTIIGIERECWGNYTYTLKCDVCGKTISRKKGWMGDKQYLTCCCAYEKLAKPKEIKLSPEATALVHARRAYQGMRSQCKKKGGTYFDEFEDIVAYIGGVPEIIPEVSWTLVRADKSTFDLRKENMKWSPKISHNFYRPIMDRTGLSRHVLTDRMSSWIRKKGMTLADAMQKLSGSPLKMRSKRYVTREHLEDVALFVGRVYGDWIITGITKLRDGRAFNVRCRRCGAERIYTFAKVINPRYRYNCTCSIKRYLGKRRNSSCAASGVISNTIKSRHLAIKVSQVTLSQFTMDFAHAETIEMYAEQCLGSSIGRRIKQLELCTY